MFDPAQSGGNTVGLPSLSVSYGVELELPPEAIEMRVPEGAELRGFDKNTRELAAERAIIGPKLYVSEEGAIVGDTEVQWGDQPEGLLNSPDTANSGVFFIVPQSNEPSRTWVFDTTSRPEAKAQFRTLVGHKPQRIYYERAVTGALEDFMEAGEPQFAL